MTYSTKVTSYLSGLSPSQLRSWYREGIFRGEHSTRGHYDYSFRDLIALRMLAALRAEFPLKEIKKAADIARERDATCHLSQFLFQKAGGTIAVSHATDNGDRGYQAAFRNLQGQLVPPLKHPHPGIEIDPNRLSGTPTVEGTRIPYDLIVTLAENMTPKEIIEEYPTLDEDGIQHALSFHQAIEAGDDQS